VDQDGVLWIGTYGGGLARLDPGTETFASYQRDPADPRSVGGDSVAVLLVRSELVHSVSTANP
jgi:hypothetical protein